MTQENLIIETGYVIQKHNRDGVSPPGSPNWASRDTERPKKKPGTAVTTCTKRSYKPTQRRGPLQRYSAELESGGTGAAKNEDLNKNRLLSVSFSPVQSTPN